jgi:hypoxia up-regulated 1
MNFLLKLCVLLSFLIYECVSVGVMGIDFGTDWFKVAVVKPGIPLEVVLNKESKRKTETVVTIRNGIRYFGSDAVSLVSLLCPSEVSESLGRQKTAGKLRKA